MKIIEFSKWTRKKVHEHGYFTQTINIHYVNIIVFGCVWKALEWTEYINHFHDD